MNSFGNFINPSNKLIKRIEAKLRNKKPVHGEMEWINKKIKYGSEQLIDLEFKYLEPVGLRKDYEVIKTREGSYLERVILLASLLSLRYGKENIEIYGKEAEWEDSIYEPFNNIILYLKNKKLFITPKEILYSDEVDKEELYHFENEEFEEDTWRIRNLGMKSLFKLFWEPIFIGNKNGIYYEIFGKVDESRFYRIYWNEDIGLCEVWNWEKVKKEEEFYVCQSSEEEIVKIKDSILEDYEKRNLWRQRENEKFIIKIKKRMNLNLGNSIAYL